MSRWYSTGPENHGSCGETVWRVHVWTCSYQDVCVSLYSGVCNTCLSSQSCVSNCFRASWCLLLFCSVRRSVMSELRWSAAEGEWGWGDVIRRDQLWLAEDTNLVHWEACWRLQHPQTDAACWTGDTSALTGRWHVSKMCVQAQWWWLSTCWLCCLLPWGVVQPAEAWTAAPEQQKTTEEEPGPHGYTYISHVVLCCVIQDWSESPRLVSGQLLTWEKELRSETEWLLK